MVDLKKPEDDGLTHIQRLSPDQFDVVLGSHPSKSKVVHPPASGSYGGKILFLAVLGIGGYFLATQLHASKPAVSPVAVQPAAVEADEPVAESTAPLLKHKSVAAPEPVLSVADGEPAPLPTQHVAQTAPAQGMVSAAYMADFKHDLQHSSTAQKSVRVDIATATIREWDGRNRYRAQWRIYNNHIEGNSVCFNFPGESVEHRECRKAAQVFFKEECREWTKRSDSDREEKSKMTQTRYCEAAGSFNPAG
ncbi:MAG: hypothetical protein JWQ69_427 [Pseudomonas sp.]|nr:hypothetical protein [Pseudomonas sp.]